MTIKVVRRTAAMQKIRMQSILALSLTLVLMLAPGVNAALFEILPDAGYGNLDTGATHGAGPVAATISFIYLQYKYPTVYGNSLVTNPITTAFTLASPQYMNTSLLSGTWVRDFVWGKSLYIEAKAPQTTSYLAQTVPQGDYSSSNPGGWTSTRPKPAWVTEGNPSWSFIYQELVKHADVEIALFWGAGDENQHMVTATGLSFNDANGDLQIQQSENATLYYIDPNTGQAGTKQIWMNDNGFLETDYVTGSCIKMAVSESPVPLPSTLLLFGSGFLGLLGLRRRQSRSR